MSGKKKRASSRASYIYIGGVKLEAGFYLPSNSDAPVKRKPDKNYGYAHYDGETLTLQNYIYCGPGIQAGDVAAGIDLSNATTALCFKGENTIEVLGGQYAAALLVDEGQVTISGKGTLSLNAHEATHGNYGILGSGKVRVDSGTVKLHADLPQTTVSGGRRVYLG